MGFETRVVVATLCTGTMYILYCVFFLMSFSTQGFMRNIFYAVFGAILFYLRGKHNALHVYTVVHKNATNFRVPVQNTTVLELYPQDIF